MINANSHCGTLRYLLIMYTMLLLGDLRDEISRERSGQSVSLLSHLKQRLLPWNS